MSPLHRHPTSLSPTARHTRAQRIVAKLARSIPQVRVELSHSNPLQLLIATILSAQCTDERVNRVTPALFARYPTAQTYAGADVREVETLIKSTGFYKSKAKNLIACGRALSERYEGQVPGRMEELVALPGVGRKTANVILGAAFGQPAVVVDTHVKRVAARLGFTRHDDPGKIEEDLQALLPMRLWTSGSQRLLLHGRYTCLARKPRCGQCVIASLCHWKGKLAS